MPITRNNIKMMLSLKNWPPKPGKKKISVDGCSIMSYTPPPKMNIEKPTKRTIITADEGWNWETWDIRNSFIFLTILDKTHPRTCNVFYLKIQSFKVFPLWVSKSLQTSTTHLPVRWFPEIRFRYLSQLMSIARFHASYPRTKFLCASSWMRQYRSSVCLPQITQFISRVLSSSTL